MCVLFIGIGVAVPGPVALLHHVQDCGLVALLQAEVLYFIAWDNHLDILSTMARDSHYDKSVNLAISQCAIDFCARDKVLGSLPDFLLYAIRVRTDDVAGNAPTPFYLILRVL